MEKVTHEFNSYSVKIKNAKNLEDLFGLWEQAHREEKNCGETFPKSNNGDFPSDNFKNSFCPDGVTSINKKIESEGDAKVEVLFILKEANAFDNIKDNNPDKNNSFWFNDKSIKGRSKTLYTNRISDILKRLNFNDDDFKFGYMNINKRGGYGSTNLQQLKNYANKYSSFIKKQIELHDPSYIILCGYTNKKIFDDTFINKIIPDKYKNKTHRIYHLAAIKGYNKSVEEAFSEEK